MSAIRTRPGPAAAHAFRLGVVAGAVIGLAGVGLLFWSGTLGPIIVGYVLLFLFPVYLVVVAVVLSRWLGYDADITSLRPVYRNEKSE